MKIGLAVEALAALAQESRLSVFRLLVQAGKEGVAAGVLGERLGIPPATLSFHLKTLKEAGLLQDRREGRWIYYSLDPAALDELTELVHSLKARSLTAVRATQKCD